MIERLQEEITQNWVRDKEPQVSIITHAYNHEKYIEQALDSFLMQETNFPFVILIHDDASTDATTCIIKEYQKKYPGIIKPIIQTENQYSKVIHSAFTDFMNSPKTKYVAMCECDDYWLDKTKLQKQFDFMEKNEEFSVCYHDKIKVDAEGNFINFESPEKDASKEDLIKKAISFHTSTMFFRSTVLPLPDEYSVVWAGDAFLKPLFAGCGIGKKLENIKPSVCRQHNKGVSKIYKGNTRIKNGIATQLFISNYYDRINQKEYADYFFDNLAKIILDNYSLTKTMRHVILRIPKGLSFRIKMIIKKVIPRYAWSFLKKEYNQIKSNKNKKEFLKHSK